MLSFQKWKMLNEAFGGSYTLGLAQRQNLGIRTNNPISEAGLRRSKKMMADGGFGGGDEGPDGGMPMLPKKKGKPFGHHDDEDMDDMPHHHDDEDMDDDMDHEDHDDDMDDDDDMDGDEDGGDLDDGDDDMDGDEAGDEDMGDDMGHGDMGGDDMGGPGGDMAMPMLPKKRPGAPMMMSKKGMSKKGWKPKGNATGGLDKKWMDKGDHDEDCTCPKCKKMCKKRMCKDEGDKDEKWQKKSKKLNKEDAQFFSSLKTMMGTQPQQVRYNDGISEYMGEDFLIEPSARELQHDAPVRDRGDISGHNPLPPFEEWSKKYLGDLAPKKKSRR